MTQNEALDNVTRYRGLRLRHDAATATATRLAEEGNDAAAIIAIAVGDMLRTAGINLASAATNLCHSDFARAALEDLLPRHEMEGCLVTVSDDRMVLPGAYGRPVEVCVAAELGKAEDQLEVACFLLQRAENRLADAEAANNPAQSD